MIFALRSTLAKFFICKLRQKLRLVVLSNIVVHKNEEGKLQLLFKKSIVVELIFDHDFVTIQHFEEMFDVVGLF